MTAHPNNHDPKQSTTERESGVSTSPPIQPAPPPDHASLPHPLTFFLTAHERTRVLKALKKFNQNRSAALMQLVDTRSARQPDG